MNSSLIIFTVFLVLFLINFLVELVVVILLGFKTQKLKKIVLNNGYSSSNVSGVVLPAQEQMENFKDSYGHSLFSFDYHLISNFGKEILSHVNNENYKEQVTDLKKIHRTYIRLLISGIVLLLASIIVFFLISSKV